VRIPVMWARVGAKRRWLFFYISYVAHMSQKKVNESILKYQQNTYET
jgi:hypothetical protein